MEPVDPASLTGLAACITDARFQPYLSECAGDQATAIRLYCWNTEVNGALLGGFSALEVALRNAMHARLVDRFGDAEWWWQYTLHSSDHREIETAMDRLDRLKSGQWTPGHVIAELGLGFWTGLLANRYHSALWERTLEGAFPNYTGRRGDLHRILERIRKLRNRVAHHEPVYARDLLYDHSAMCAMAGYVSADVEIWITSHSRLPSILAGKGATLDGTRPTRF